MSVASESNTMENLMEMASELSAKERLNLAMAVAKGLKKDIGSGKKARKSKKTTDSDGEEEEKPKRVASQAQKDWREFIARVRKVVNESDRSDVDKFKYREGMQIASIIKDAGNQDSITDEGILEAYDSWKEEKPMPKLQRVKLEKESASESGSVAKKVSKKKAKAKEEEVDSEVEVEEEKPKSAPEKAKSVPKKEEEKPKTAPKKEEEKPKPALKKEEEKPKPVPKKAVKPIWREATEDENGKVEINGQVYEWLESDKVKYLWNDTTGRYSGAWSEKRNEIDDTVPEPPLED